MKSACRFSWTLTLVLLPRIRVSRFRPPLQEPSCRCLKAPISTDPVPLIRGEALIENVKPYDFLAGVVQPPYMRKLWDARTESGMMMKRYSVSGMAHFASASRD